MKVCDFSKLLVIGILVFAVTLAVHGASQKDSAVVKDVVLKPSGESLEARITSTEGAKFTYFELDAPHRLVVDFHGIQNKVGFKEKQVDVAGVQRVRASYFSTQGRQATRIVFDLAKDVNYQVVGDAAGVVRVVFGNPATTVPAGESQRAPLTLTAGPPPAGPPPAGPPVIAVVEETPPALVAQLQQPSLPLQQFAALQPAVTARPAPLASAVPAASALVATMLAQISTAPPATTPTLTAPAQPQTFNGEIISLDLKDVDLKDFFRFLADISGLNIVLDPNVTGTVTLLVRDLPWDQALDIVLRNNNLGGQIQGNVLRVATNATLQAEEDQRKRVRDAQAALAPMVTQTYLLNYTKADSVVGTLKTSGLLSQRGSLVPVPGRNALLVTDLPGQFDTIEQLLKFIDVPSQQVDIEARLLSANKSFSQEFGSQLGLLIGNNTGNMLTGGSGQASPFQRTPPPRVTAGGSGLPLLSNLPAAATSGIAFLLQPGGDVLLDAIITAAEASGTAKLISRPHVTTQNNQVATISQGTQIPVQTNVNNTISVQFLNFALKLSVTPQITQAGTILLTVEIENSQPDFARAVNGIPSVSTQQATTQVLIEDGATAMIGGIYLETDSLNIRQVPGLGSIPIIGHLFKNTQTIKSTAELIFFITPRIKASDALTITAPAN